MSGLNIWKNSYGGVALDAESVFWAIAPNKDKDTVFIPEEALNLYASKKDNLDGEMKEFRFAQELTAIYINPTDKCNAGCLYCYIPAKIRKNGRSMTWGELEFILNKLAKYFKGGKRKQVIIFHASEPLLAKEIVFKAIKKYSKVFKFGLQTNAILLEKEDVDFLKKFRVGVGISLDSNLSLVNDKLRPAGKSGGNFSPAVRAIEWFNGYSGLNVITTVTKFNVKDLPGIVRFLHSKRVPCVLLNPMRFTHARPSVLKPDGKIMAKHFIKAVDTAIELSRNSDHRIIVGNFTNTILAIIAPLARRLMCDISPCGGGRCFFTITARGEIIPCGEFIGLKGFSGGNIFSKNGTTNVIDKALGSKPFKMVRERAVEKIDECDVCAFRNVCGAPCPAELHSLGGMFRKSVFCDFYKEIIQHAFKMIAEDKVKYLLRDESTGNLKFAYNLNPG